jgi:hypothetical protein
MTSSKKSETIEVRLPFAAKLAFAERCRADGVTMSHAIRRFVETPRRRGSNIAIGLALAGALALLFAPISGRADYGAGFEKLDRNSDGVLTAAEVPAEAAGYGAPLALPLARGWLGNGPRFATCLDGADFAALDRSGDGLVTRQEYAAHRLALLRDGFDALDRDGDGTLNAAEYDATKNIRFLSKPPVLARFNDLDRNGDRRVTFAEYLR